MEKNLGEVGRMLGNLRHLAVEMGDEIAAQNKQLDRIEAKSSSVPRRGAWTSQTARKSSPIVGGDEPVPEVSEAVSAGKDTDTQQTKQLPSQQLTSATEKVSSAMDSLEREPVKRGGTRTWQTARKSTGGRAPRKMLEESTLIEAGDETVEDGLEIASFTAETAAPFGVRFTQNYTEYVFVRKSLRGSY